VEVCHARRQQLPLRKWLRHYPKETSADQRFERGGKWLSGSSPYSQSQPYPSLDGLRNAQRLMAQQNPKIAALKVEELTDARFVRKLDESGFIDRLYAAR
jgi:hypothetical protein